MIKVEQSCTDFINGDCMRACVASILELPLQKVPNFMEKGKDQYDKLVSKWESKTGILLLETRIEGKPNVGDCFAIAVGKSPRSKNKNHCHAVVWWKDRMIHDPSPNKVKVGLDGDPEYFAFLVMKDPSKWTKNND